MYVRMYSGCGCINGCVLLFIRSSQWTKELEEKLKQAVEKYGCNEKSWYAGKSHC